MSLFHPGDVHALVSRICEYNTLHDQGNSAKITKFTVDLKIGKSSWIMRVGSIKITETLKAESFPQLEAEEICSKEESKRNAADGGVGEI